MNLTNILFIENSIGLAGSTMSLCSLLDYLDADLFEVHIALSRNEQEGYLLGHLRRPANMSVIAPAASLRQARWAQRLLDFAQRRAPWLRGSVARAIAVLEVFAVTIPYAFRLRRWIKDRVLHLTARHRGHRVVIEEDIAFNAVNGIGPDRRILVGGKDRNKGKSRVAAGP